MDGTDSENALQMVDMMVENAVEDLVARKSFSNELTRSQFETYVDNVVEDVSRSKNLATLFESRDSDGTDDFLHLSSINQADLNALLDSSLHAKSNDLRLKYLTMLLQSGQVVDLPYHKKWPAVGKLLRDQLAGKNDDLFLTSYNIHAKLLIYPTTTDEALLNVLKSLISIFQAKKSLPLHEGISLTEARHSNIMKLMHLVLDAQKDTCKKWLRANDRIVEDTIQCFFDLISNNAHNCLNPIHFLSVLDTSAAWFDIWTCSVQTSRIVERIVFKQSNFLKFISGEFLRGLERDHCAKSHVDSVIGEPEIKLATFAHCTKILIKLASMTQAMECFPIETEALSEPLSTTTLFHLTFSALNSAQTNPQTKRAMIKVITPVLKNKTRIFENANSMQAFLLPLTSLENAHLSHLKNFVYIFEILEEVAAAKEGLEILYGTNHISEYYKKKLAKSSSSEMRNSSSFTLRLSRSDLIFFENDKQDCPAKTVVDFTAKVLQTCLNDPENLKLISPPFRSMISALCSILSVHSHSYCLVKTSKLFGTALNLHKVANSCDHFVCMDCIEDLVLCAASAELALKGLNEDFDYFYNVISAILQKISIEHRLAGKLISNISKRSVGFSTLSNNSRKLLSESLNAIWCAEEDEISLMSGSDRKLSDAISSFLKSVWPLVFTFTAIKALLADDDNEGTITDESESPQTFKELIQSACQPHLDASTLTGLMLVKLLMVNPKTMIFLINDMQIQEKLMDVQSAFTIQSDDRNKLPIIIDECSLLRHRILVAIQDFGSITKNNLNDLKLSARSQINSALLRSRNKAANELQKFLLDCKYGLHDHHWLSKLKRVHRAVLPDVLKPLVLIELLEQVHKAMAPPQVPFPWPASNVEYKFVSNEMRIGVSLVVRFGTQNGLLQTVSQNEENLILLLNQIRAIQTTDSFDWFVAVVFLISSGNLERTRTTIQSLARFPTVSFLWWASTDEIFAEDRAEFLNVFYHYLDIVIEDNAVLGTIFESFGVQFSAIYDMWLRQCFFNILEWNEICHLLAICILYPVEYLLYGAVCMASYLCKNLQRIEQSEKPIDYSSAVRMDGFHWHDYMTQMDSLCKQYKQIQLKHC